MLSSNASVGWEYRVRTSSVMHVGRLSAKDYIDITQRGLMDSIFLWSSVFYISFPYHRIRKYRVIRVQMPPFSPNCLIDLCVLLTTLHIWKDVLGSLSRSFRFRLKNSRVAKDRSLLFSAIAVRGLGRYLSLVFNQPLIEDWGQQEKI